MPSRPTSQRWSTTSPSRSTRSRRPARTCSGSTAASPTPAEPSGYAGALPDPITIYRGPLIRHYGRDPELLRSQIRRTVLHEIAHHFGISDERLVEIDRY